MQPARNVLARKAVAVLWSLLLLSADLAAAGRVGRAGLPLQRRLLTDDFGEHSYLNSGDTPYHTSSATRRILATCQQQALETMDAESWLTIKQTGLILFAASQVMENPKTMANMSFIVYAKLRATGPPSADAIAKAYTRLTNALESLDGCNGVNPTQSVRHTSPSPSPSPASMLASPASPRTNLTPASPATLPSPSPSVTPQNITQPESMLDAIRQEIQHIEDLQNQVGMQMPRRRLAAPISGGSSSGILTTLSTLDGRVTAGTSITQIGTLGETWPETSFITAPPEVTQSPQTVDEANEDLDNFALGFGIGFGTSLLGGASGTYVAGLTLAALSAAGAPVVLTAVATVAVSVLVTAAVSEAATLILENTREVSNAEQAGTQLGGLVGDLVTLSPAKSASTTVSKQFSKIIKQPWCSSKNICKAKLIESFSQKVDGAGTIFWDSGKTFADDWVPSALPAHQNPVIPPCQEIAGTYSLDKPTVPAGCRKEIPSISSLTITSTCLYTALMSNGYEQAGMYKPDKENIWDGVLTALQVQANGQTMAWSTAFPTVSATFQLIGSRVLVRDSGCVYSLLIKGWNKGRGDVSIGPAKPAAQAKPKTAYAHPVGYSYSVPGSGNLMFFLCECKHPGCNVPEDTGLGVRMEGSEDCVNCGGGYPCPQGMSCEKRRPKKIQEPSISFELCV